MTLRRDFDIIANLRKAEIGRLERALLRHHVCSTQPSRLRRFGMRLVVVLISIANWASGTTPQKIFDGCQQRIAELENQLAEEGMTMGCRLVEAIARERADCITAIDAAIRDIDQRINYESVELVRERTNNQLERHVLERAAGWAQGMLLLLERLQATDPADDAAVATIHRELQDRLNIEFERVATSDRIHTSVEQSQVWRNYMNVAIELSHRGILDKMTNQTPDLMENIKAFKLVLRAILDRYIGLGSDHPARMRAIRGLQDDSRIAKELRSRI